MLSPEEPQETLAPEPESLPVTPLITTPEENTSPEEILVESVISEQVKQEPPPRPAAMSYVMTNTDGPVAPYYTTIVWPGFEKWQLVRFSTPMDGSCLFHAIANAFFKPYREENLGGVKVSREKIIAAFRQNMSDKLASKISTATDSKTYYETLNKGNTLAFSTAVPEFKLEHMQTQLNSKMPIGYGYMEFIGNVLDKDIYILDGLRQDIYVTDELPLTITGNRGSIVLYYMNGHYELVGVRHLDGSFDTFFSPHHSLIETLYARTREFIQ